MRQTELPRLGLRVSELPHDLHWTPLRHLPRVRKCKMMPGLGACESLPRMMVPMRWKYIYCCGVRELRDVQCTSVGTVLLSSPLTHLITSMSASQSSLCTTLCPSVSNPISTLCAASLRLFSAGPPSDISATSCPGFTGLVDTVTHRVVQATSWAYFHAQ
ncbi:hypothetical protein EV702DRAFT_1110202 [Suillus placidus]|uniref:Uncharacterized protein n=1 Tax=Suillus placidus TaxID=48579 RepID=A0A9P6ZUE4_9AGAM|nr:hypothetical protein EV702DRAFT_1110202 [Suillus placidus]